MPKLNQGRGNSARNYRRRLYKRKLRSVKIDDQAADDLIRRWQRETANLDQAGQAPTPDEKKYSPDSLDWLTDEK